MEWLTIVHLIFAVHFWFACFYDWNFVIIPHDVERMGPFKSIGKLKFLTYLNALLQAFFFTVCVLNDFFGSTENNIKKKAPLIRRFKDSIFSCLAFPLSLFVGSTFWAIYFVDRELVFPKSIDPYFPTWLNHLMHTNIMIFSIFELFTSSRKYPSRKFGLGVLSIFMLAYLVWIHVIHAYANIWVYPILDVLNFPLRVVFFLSLFALVTLLYVVGEKLNNLVWGKHLKAQ